MDARQSPGRSHASDLRLMVRQLDLWRHLDAESRRQLRAVCSELRAEADALIDTLVLPLDHATCCDVAASRVAAFHRQCPAAHALRVHVSYVWSSYDDKDEEPDAIHFMDAYAAAIGQAGLPATHCTISVAGGCRLRPSVLSSLMGVLPATMDLRFTGDGEDAFSSPHDAVHTLGVLAGCPQLRSLALIGGFPRQMLYTGYHAKFTKAISQLAPLRAVSLNCEVYVNRHLRCFTRLACLERLGVAHLHGAPSAETRLAGVHTLCAAWPLPEPEQRGGDHAIAYGAMGATVDEVALNAFPALQRLEGVTVLTSPHHWSSPLVLTPRHPAARSVAVVRRFAACAEAWALRIMLPRGREGREGLPEWAQHMTPGSMAPLRHVWLDVRDGTLQEVGAFLQRLVAAAPGIVTVCLNVYLNPALLEGIIRAMLPPFKQAAGLRTLCLLHNPRPRSAQSLAAMVRYLASPEPGGGACCAALRVVRVRAVRDDGGVVTAAAEVLRAEGCPVRLEGCLA